MVKMAFLFAFLLIFSALFLSFLGPCEIPPPTQIGERLDPCLALPVPFCCHGFFPPPDTSLLSFVCAKTFLALALSERKTCLTNSAFHGKPNTLAESVKVPFSFPLLS